MANRNVVERTFKFNIDINNDSGKINAISDIIAKVGELKEITERGITVVFNSPDTSAIDEALNRIKEINDNPIPVKFTPDTNELDTALEITKDFVGTIGDAANIIDQKVGILKDGFRELEGQATRLTEALGAAQSDKIREDLENVKRAIASINEDQIKLDVNEQYLISQVKKAVSAAVKAAASTDDKGKIAAKMDVPVKAAKLTNAHVNEAIKEVKAEAKAHKFDIEIPLVPKDLRATQLRQKVKDVNAITGDAEDLKIKIPLVPGKISIDQARRVISETNEIIKQTGRQVTVPVRISLVNQQVESNIVKIEGATNNASLAFDNLQYTIRMSVDASIGPLKELKSIVDEIAASVKEVKDARITARVLNTGTGESKVDSVTQKNLEQYLSKNKSEADKLVVKLSELQTKFDQINRKGFIDPSSIDGYRQASKLIEEISLQLENVRAGGFIDANGILNAKKLIASLAEEIKLVGTESKKSSTEANKTVKEQEQRMARLLKTVRGYIDASRMRGVEGENVGLNYIGTQEQLSKIEKARDALKSFFNQLTEIKGGISKDQYDAYFRQFSELANELERVEKRFQKKPFFREKFISDGSIKSIDEAKKKILELEQVSNPKNLLWTTKVQGDIVKLTGAFEDQAGSLRQVSYEYDSANGNLKEMQATEKETLGFFGSLTKLIQQRGQALVAYVSTFASFYRVISTFREGVAIVKEMDTNMTELRRVSGATQKQLDAFRNSVFETGREIGATSGNITNLASNYARLGYSLAEAQNLAKSTAIYMNVGFIDDANFAMESLTSTMKAYGMAASEVSKIVDEFNEVGKNYCPRMAISVKGWGHQRPSKDLTYCCNVLKGISIADGNKRRLYEGKEVRYVYRKTA